MPPDPPRKARASPLSDRFAITSLVMFTLRSCDCAWPSLKSWIRHWGNRVISSFGSTSTRPAASREMLVISRQNGLRLLSSRLSGYRQKATRWSAAAMICTDRLRVKLKDLRGGVPVGRFFPYFFCWLLHRADVLHLRITSRFTFLFVVLCVCEWQGCSRTWRSFLSYYYWYSESLQVEEAGPVTMWMWI